MQTFGQKREEGNWYVAACKFVYRTRDFNEKISKDKSAWKTNEYVCVVVVLFEFGREDYQQQQQQHKKRYVKKEKGEARGVFDPLNLAPKCNNQLRDHSFSLPFGTSS